jgi:hypothetical protein
LEKVTPGNGPIEAENASGDVAVNTLVPEPLNVKK